MYTCNIYIYIYIYIHTHYIYIYTLYIYTLYIYIYTFIRTELTVHAARRASVLAATRTAAGRAPAAGGSNQLGSLHQNLYSFVSCL